MKRSEMLEHLRGYFVANSSIIHAWSLNPHQIPDFVLDMLLKCVEDKGMLPPIYVYWNSKTPEDVNERGIPKQLEVSIHNGDELNEWEPE